MWVYGCAPEDMLSEEARRVLYGVLAGVVNGVEEERRGDQMVSPKKEAIASVSLDLHV